MITLTLDQNEVQALGALLDAAVKATGTTLQARLADDTGFATFDGILSMEGTAPSTTNSTGTAGEIRYDSGFIYVCTATDTWKRVAIATW